MADKTEKKYIGDIVRQEKENYASRKLVTIASSAALLAGTILGLVSVGALSQATSGTGNGTLTGLAAKDKTMVGDYIVECILAATDGGTFKVLDPTGNRLDDAKVGTLYDNDHLTFTINDGGTDHAVGKKFTITVAAGSGKYKRSVVTAVDGSQNGAAILLEDADASGGDVTEVLVLAEDAQVEVSQLIYDASADDDAKKLILRKDLEAKGIQFLSPA